MFLDSSVSNADVSRAVIGIFEEKSEEGIAAAMSSNLTQLQNTRYEKNYFQLLERKYFRIGPNRLQLVCKGVFSYSLEKNWSPL